jgi:[protein-PII] uridylyltransferase
VATALDKNTLSDIRHRAQKLFDDGAMGLQIASMLSDAMDEFVVDILENALKDLPEGDRELITQHSAMIAIGGSGRGQVSPFSDVDLLFVVERPVIDLFGGLIKRLVPEYWDAGIKLGQRVHTVKDAVRQAIGDPHLASSLVHARGLWGQPALGSLLRRRFYRRAVVLRRNAFLENCIAARQDERREHGATVQQLEPDVKRSLGGLRDVHLLEWVAYAHYQTTNLDELLSKNALSREDTDRLKRAVEFLTRIRIELHLVTTRGNDVLTRDEQLRIADSRGIEHDGVHRPVEILMRTYFEHSSAVAEISRRFVGRHRPRPLTRIIRQAVLSHRIGHGLVLGTDELDIVPSRVDEVCSTLDDAVRIYQTAIDLDVAVAPQLSEVIRNAARLLRPPPSDDVSRRFLKVLKTHGRLGSTVRNMHDTGILDCIIPEWRHVRNLLQFNQYHHFTVDEHTLQCLEICAGFSADTPWGAACERIQSKELLHLALLLHDVGKGYPEDHSTVGARLAGDVCRRLCMSESRTDIVQFLVLRHLEMADLAFRHDISDERVLMEFSRKVGTADKLTMLYVLTVADVSGVGRGVWNNWKAELLTDLYGRLMMILSGDHPRFHEKKRLQQVREHVRNSIVPLASNDKEDDPGEWIDRQLDAFSSPYVMGTEPIRIATDLSIIQSLRPDDVHVEGKYDEQQDRVDYRIIIGPELSRGCFHRIAGVLTARHLEVLGAEITTSHEDVVVDVFHVLDQDYSGKVPEFRIREVCESIADVLHRRVTVPELFRRHSRFAADPPTDPAMDQPIRVDISSETSDRSTVVSVFALDQPGLLYTITRTLFQLGLSIEQARIATHLDQVADIFYVTDHEGRQIESELGQAEMRNHLLEVLTEFERTTHRDFVQ